MRLPTLLAAAAALAFTGAAHANPNTYSIAGDNLTDPTKTGRVTGTTTIEVNKTIPSVLSVYLNFSNGTSPNRDRNDGQDRSHKVYLGVANDLFSFVNDLHNYLPEGGNFNLRDFWRVLRHCIFFGASQ